MKKVGQAVPPVLDALAKQSEHDVFDGAQDASALLPPGECPALPACKRRILSATLGSIPKISGIGRNRLFLQDSHPHYL